MTAPPPALGFDGEAPIPLDSGWTFAGTGPSACQEPSQLPEGLDWRPAPVPGTVAQALGAEPEGGPALDAQDWWYRCDFPAPEGGGGGRWRLRFEGLATLAEAWLNGERILASDTMFLPQACEVGDRLRPRNDLLLRFRALEPELARRRPRPRWRTALVANQNLRWFRTSLLGRIPGWAPALPAVGPWRPVRLEPVGALEVRAFRLQPRLEDGVPRLDLALDLAHGEAAAPTGGWVRVGDRREPLALVRTAGGSRFEGSFRLPGLPRWDPHTHGTPALVDCAVELATPQGPRRLDGGPIGFREVVLAQAEGGLQFQVNGQAVFCRGACWTVQDARTLTGSEAELRATLTLARDAGFNMIRVGGTMAYESDAFYGLCDELGLLVWQDFMFANLDYPFADEGFRQGVEAEAAFHLARLQRHACVAAYCGSSEVAQQAAMLGQPPEAWSGEFYDQTLPRLCAEHHPGVPYVPSTPCGGALPFHTSEGLTHYYGVGAYRRPLEDARRARVKFTPECLGFSNVPDPETLDLLADGALLPTHHPRWKARVPRDSGVGWDFEDIRDHYLGRLFAVEPVELRSRDLARYLELSRAVTGEAMKAVFAEWRRPGSGCGGGLVWFLKDLWPGAGWGLLDSTGRPKAAYWHLRRAFAPRTVLITDEGLEGIHLHAFNERPEPLEAELELELLQGGRIPVGRGSRRLRLPAFGAETVSGEALFPAFMDLAYAYRFGPPRHDVAVARLREAASGRSLGSDVHLPLGHGRPFAELPGLQTAVRAFEDGTAEVELRTEAFLQGVHLACADRLPDDNAFPLPPGEVRVVRFRPSGRSGGPPPGPFKVRLMALNLREGLTLRPDAPAGS
ncbi:MAG TPA: hypothetical protein VFT46_03285 [Holophagaceae bacterium]|nr:hypothetical protein [Holophagaceae bacterium]